MARNSAQASPLTAPRERRTQQLLTRLAGTGSEKLRRQIGGEIVEANLALSDTLARRYAGRGIELDDLTQVARAGLVVAVRRYRPELQTPFAAFAVPTIVGEIKRHFRDHGWVIRPPRRVQELRAKLFTRQRQLEQSGQRSISVREVSEDLGLSRVEAEECATAWKSFRPQSLDAVPAHDGESSHESEPLSNQVAAGDDAMERVDDLVSLQASVDQLSTRDRTILRWRFFEDRTQSDIGKRLGVSQMQVSRILARILRQTRGLMADEPQLAAS